MRLKFSTSARSWPHPIHLWCEDYPQLHHSHLQPCTKICHRPVGLLIPVKARIGPLVSYMEINSLKSTGLISELTDIGPLCERASGGQPLPQGPVMFIWMDVTFFLFQDSMYCDTLWHLLSKAIICLLRSFANSIRTEGSLMSCSERVQGMWKKSVGNNDNNLILPGFIWGYLGKAWKRRALQPENRLQQEGEQMEIQ